MQYVAMLYGDERVSEPASEAWQAALPGYGRCGQLAGEAIVGGGALEGVAAAAATVGSTTPSPRRRVMRSRVAPPSTRRPQPRPCACETASCC